MTRVAPTPSDKSVLTYSALNTFRNCPRKYKHRYVDCLRPREKPDALSFGSVIHGALELWYQSAANPNRLWTVLEFLDQQFPERTGDEAQKAAWHLARAMFLARPCFARPQPKLILKSLSQLLACIYVTPRLLESL